MEFSSSWHNFLLAVALPKHIGKVTGKWPLNICLCSDWTRSRPVFLTSHWPENQCCFKGSLWEIFKESHICKNLHLKAEATRKCNKLYESVLKVLYISMSRCMFKTETQTLHLPLHLYQNSVKMQRQLEVGQPLLFCCQLNVGSVEGQGDVSQARRLKQFATSTGSTVEDECWGKLLHQIPGSLTRITAIHLFQINTTC